MNEFIIMGFSKNASIISIFTCFKRQQNIYLHHNTIQLILQITNLIKNKNHGVYL
jgi:hypothetical protein